MERIDNARFCLERKLSLFKQYERVTAAMLETDDLVVIENYITERSKLANQIDELDVQVAEQLGEWPQASALLSGSAGEEEIPPELMPLRELCLEIMGLVRRIRLTNAEVTERCISMRDQSERSIRQSRNTPKISKYLSNLTGGHGGNGIGKV